VTDTLWSDVSEFQVPASNAYPYHFICFRSNDGTYEDHHFVQNIAWARGAVHAGKLWGFMVYYFYRPGVNGAGVLMSRVGKPDADMAVMIDVEGAGGQVSGNQSNAINAQHDQLGKWLGNPSRVVGYGNTSDLNALWPSKPRGLRIVVAAYGSNPGYPGKFAHQFTDRQNTAPFGPSDFNSADGMSASDLQKMYGFTQPKPPPPPAASNVHTFTGGETMWDVAHSRGYPTTAAWLAHEGNLDVNVGAALIGLDEKALAAIKPAAGTKWLTNQ
jgi:hypothetical protein